MAIYVVGYDLHPKQGETYSELIDACKKAGTTYWHCLDSTWLIKTDKTVIQLRDELWKHMKADDQLLVAQYAHGYSAWAGFTAGNCGEWLKANM